MLIHKYILAPPFFYSNLVPFMFRLCQQSPIVQADLSLFTQGFRYCTVQDTFWAVLDEWNTLLIIADRFMSIATQVALSDLDRISCMKYISFNEYTIHVFSKHCSLVQNKM